MSYLNNQVNQYGVQELGNLMLSVTGGAVFYVGSEAQLQRMTPDVGQGITQRLYSNINTALGQCANGRGDVVYLLPGYTESIGAADSWSGLLASDVSVIGLGRGTNRAALTWTASGSTVLFDQANFRLQNVNLFLAGAHSAGAALTVAAPITVSAAGCAILDSTILYGFDADQGVTIGITVTAGTYWEFKRNYCFCAQAAGATLTTSFMYLDGAHFQQIHDNVIDGSTSSTTVGSVRFINNASTGIDWRRNTVSNKKASSVHAVTQMAGVLGQVTDCSWGVLNDSGLGGWVPAGAGDGPIFGRCSTTNLAGENGGVMTPASAA